MAAQHNISRRSFIRTAVLIGGGMLVAACSGQAPAQPGATPGSGQSQPSGNQTVTLIDHMWTGPYDDEFHKPQIAKFEAANPGIKINSQWFPRSDIHTKEIALAASGQLGDNFTYNTAAFAKEFIFKGVSHDIDSLRKDDNAWNTNDYPQFWPGNITNYTMNGKLWGLPQVGHPGNIIEYHNLDIINKNGAKPPDLNGNWTLDDLVDLAKKCTKGSGPQMDTYGLSWAPDQGEWLIAWLRAFGGDMYSNDGKKMLINTPESKQAMNWLNDLWQKHKVALPMQPPGQSGADPYLDTFTTGKAALFHSTTGNTAVIGKVVGDKFKWDATVDPKGPKGHGTQVSSSGYGINANTKHPKEAWTWLKWLTSKDYGVERNLAGFSSPGSRYDVWQDPRLIQKYPLYKRVFDAVIKPDPGPLPWNQPANGRYNEASTASGAILQNMLLGKITADEACAQWEKELQAILDKPNIA